jgi:hypothetical protein
MATGKSKRKKKGIVAKATVKNPTKRVRAPRMPNYPAAYFIDPNKPLFEVDMASLKLVLKLLNRKDQPESQIALSIKQAIEMALTELPGLESIHDNGPRVSNIRAELMPVEKAAKALGEALDHLSIISKLILEIQDRTLRYQDVISQVTVIEGIAQSALASLRVEDSRHGQTRQAQRIVGMRLVEIFDNYSEHPARTGRYASSIVKDEKRLFIDSVLSLANVAQSDRLLEELVP